MHLRYLIYRLKYYERERGPWILESRFGKIPSGILSNTVKLKDKEKKPRWHNGLHVKPKESTVQLWKYPRSLPRCFEILWCLLKPQERTSTQTRTSLGMAQNYLDVENSKITFLTRSLILRRQMLQKPILYKPQNKPRSS